MKNHEKLLSLFNELDDILRKRYHEFNKSNSVILRFTQDLNRINTQETIEIARKLNMIRTLRNSLIHDLSMNSDGLIEVTDDTITFLEDLINRVKFPKTAKDFATGVEKIYFLSSNKNYLIKDIIDEMRRLGFSQAPVLNEKKAVTGVFSPNVLFSYIHDHPESSVALLKLEDLKEYLPLGKHFSESYIFVKENESEDELREVYTNQLLSNRKLQMIFVTKTGSNIEPLQGIIVLKDLLKFE